ncbi:unnamed protein product [Amoebophrya sp. A120]|nr:unnamed protein product [Amoebophrya sp. A120]|eukprot:GSA120T00005056001.1
MQHRLRRERSPGRGTKGKKRHNRVETICGRKSNKPARSPAGGSHASRTVFLHRFHQCLRSLQARTAADKPVQLHFRDHHHYPGGQGGMVRRYAAKIVREGRISRLRLRQGRFHSLGRHDDILCRFGVREYLLECHVHSPRDPLLRAGAHADSTINMSGLLSRGQPRRPGPRQIQRRRRGSTRGRTATWSRLEAISPLRRKTRGKFCVRLYGKKKNYLLKTRDL